MISRRLLLVAGAVAPLVALGWLMKAAASWRPVAVGKVAIPKGGIEHLVASRHRVLAVQLTYPGTTVLSSSGDVRTHCTLFDARDGRVQSLRFSRHQLTGLEGDSFWNFYWDETKHTGHVEVKKLNKRFSFDLPNLMDQQRVTLRILPQKNRVVFLCQNHIYQWNFQTARLERNVGIEDFNGAVLSRDARAFVAFDLDGFKIGDARTGKTRKKIAFQGFRFFETLYLSPYGQYALCERPTSPTQMRVVSVATGKSLWNFESPNNDRNDWTISDDEQTIFVRKGNEWEVRDLKTGKLARRVPCVPDTSAVASSPDGATLYCVAKGVLYRQRVR